MGSIARTIRWWFPGLASLVPDDEGGVGAEAEEEGERAAELEAGGRTAAGAGGGGAAAVWDVDGAPDVSAAGLEGLAAGMGVVAFRASSFTGAATMSLRED